MGDKVRGGTPKAGTSLCLNCRTAHVIRGLNLQEIIFCKAGHPAIQISFPVVECSVFDDKRIPSRYDMENIAWTVQSRNRGPMGFAGDGKLQITIEPPEKRNTPDQQGTPAAKDET
jgi:hypothetical protein